VGAVRLWDCSCRWSNVQPRKDVFDWQTLDRLVAGARDADLPVLYTMGTPPGWACPDAKRAPYLDDCRAAPPDDLADWDAYVRATVTRYRGRIEAYELWDYINSPMRFTGDADVVAEMVGRAARIIKEVDPSALVVSPSFGDLWDPAAREKLKTYAEAGALEPCDAVAVKLHPRDYSAAPPEEMIELARLVDQTLHRVGAQRLFWGAGPSHDVGNAPRLDHAKAGAYAVRQFLVGIFAECARMYFYYWGGRNVPIVLQAEGGPPTQAAWFVDRLQRWLSGAYVRSASHGSDDNLPPNVWQLRFVFSSRPGGPPDQSSAEAVIRWTDGGTATMPLEPGTDRIEHLDGTVETPHAGATVHVTELPILIRYHPVPFRLVTRDQSLLVE
jgi:hypothetical protein